MKQFVLLLLPFLTQSVFAVTARLEARDTMGSRTRCSGVTNCSTKDVFDVGFGITHALAFESTSIKFHGGLLMRQRSSSSHDYNDTGRATFSYLEFPVQAAMEVHQFTVRLGPYVGVLIHENHAGYGSDFDYVKKDLFALPIELGVDLHFATSHQIGLSFETPVRMADGRHRVSNIDSGGAVALVYGYNFGG